MLFSLRLLPAVVALAVAVAFVVVVAFAVIVGCAVIVRGIFLQNVAEFYFLRFFIVFGLPLKQIAAR